MTSVAEEGVDTLYGEPAYYGRLFAERAADLPFYLRATDGAGAVLELGVGAGRVAIPLAEAGRSVWGVDRSPGMLAALEHRRAALSEAVQGRLTTRRADVGALALGRTFDAVLLPFNGLAHFHGPAERAALFAAVDRHLAPGGVFALDVQRPDPVLLAGGTSSVARFEHPRTGVVCRVEEEAAYDTERALLTLTTRLVPRLGGEAQTLRLVLRIYGEAEVDAILGAHGWEVLERCDLGDSVARVCVPRGRGGGARTGAGPPAQG